MQQLLIITKNALRILVRNKQSIFFTLIIPLALMLVIGFITDASTEKNLIVGISYPKENEQARRTVENLRSAPTLDIFVGELEEEKSALADDERDFVIAFPEDFSLDPNSPVSLTVYESITKRSEAAIGGLLITQYFQNAQLLASDISPWVILQREQVQAETVRYIDFLVPGLIAMTIMQLGVFSTGFALVDDKQRGVLRRVMATPIAPWQFVMGNMLARLTISLMQATILITVAFLVFDVSFSQWWMVPPLIIIGNVIFLSIGLFVSGVAKTIETVPVLGNLIVFPMLLLGGVFFPTDRFPDWLSNIVAWLPIAQLSSLLRNAVSDPKPLTEVWITWTGLFAWSILTILLANTFFKLQENE
jgi:ABC-2 type transport system permease protein